MCRAHYTYYSMKRIINAIEENLDRENIMQVWKNYTIEDAIVVIEKAIESHQAQNNKSHWRKLHPDVVHDFKGFTIEPIKEIMKKIVDMAKKKKKRCGEGEDFKICI